MRRGCYTPALAMASPPAVVVVAAWTVVLVPGGTVVVVVLVGTVVLVLVGTVVVVVLVGTVVLVLVGTVVVVVLGGTVVVGLGCVVGSGGTVGPRPVGPPDVVTGLLGWVVVLVLPGLAVVGGVAFLGRAVVGTVLVGMVEVVTAGAAASSALRCEILAFRSLISRSSWASCCALFPVLGGVVTAVGGKELPWERMML